MKSPIIVRSSLWAGVQSTLDPTAESETLCRSNALAHERRGIGWCMQCMCDV